MHAEVEEMTNYFIAVQEIVSTSHQGEGLMTVHPQFAHAKIDKVRTFV